MRKLRCQVASPHIKLAAVAWKHLTAVSRAISSTFNSHSIVGFWDPLLVFYLSMQTKCLSLSLKHHGQNSCCAAKQCSNQQNLIVNSHGDHTVVKKPNISGWVLRKYKLMHRTSPYSLSLFSSGLVSLAARCSTFYQLVSNFVCCAMLGR